MVAQTLLWVNNRELSWKSGYFGATPSPRAPGNSNSTAKLLPLGSSAHLITLEWHQRNKDLNSGQLECSSD